MATTAAQDQLRKPLAFTTTDVKGNTVICAASTWNSHIAPDHPEMVGRHGDVKDTLESPDAILLSTSSPRALIHQKVTADLVQIRVVTTYDQIGEFEDGTTIAKVNTAFPVQPEDYDSPNVGAIIYTRPIGAGLAQPEHTLSQVNASNKDEGGEQ
jgi:hypothetical protein